MLPTFFRTPKAKAFEYKPRYYDPDKEEENQEGKKRIEFRKPGEYFHPRLESKAPAKPKQNKLIIYLIIILLLLYFIFMG